MIKRKDYFGMTFLGIIVLFMLVLFSVSNVLHNSKTQYLEELNNADLKIIRTVSDNVVISAIYFDDVINNVNLRTEKEISTITVINNKGTKYILKTDFMTDTFVRTILKENEKFLSDHNNTIIVFNDCGNVYMIFQ